jgi:hypothetical protein
LIRKPEGNITLGRPGTWEGNIKMGLKEMQ